MYDKQELCEKIREVFPEIGVCGIDLDVRFDPTNQAWVVDLHKDDHHLQTFLEIPEAETCMKGRQCVSLGLQIAQLRTNLGLLH
ncbi:MAG: hypothetical protein ACOY32_10650 [Thermodesulfobacteriota bacterium]